VRLSRLKYLYLGSNASVRDNPRRLGVLFGQGPSREKRRTQELAAETRTLLERPRISPRDDDPRTALVPGPEPLAANACYLSYAWGSSAPEASPEDRQREKAANELCKAADRKGIKVVRDQDVMRFGDSILNFMKQIAQAQRIYVILSGKYLRSPFCMYELYSIWTECRRRGEVFRERISVLRLPDAAISRFEDRFGIAEWWANEHERQKAMISKAPNLVSRHDFAAFKLTGEFASHVGDILALVAYTLHPMSIEHIDDFHFE
jgi:internalin A